MWYGFFSPLRYCAVPLICLGFLTLLVLGIVALVRSQNKSGNAAATPPAAPAPEPVVEAAAAPVESAQPTAQVCPNCGQPVQADWKNCPYCGAPLT
jgi:hypothetical protein